MYEIEKNVPIPDDNVGRKSKYPFGKMMVGDSILVDVYTAVMTAYQFGKRKNQKFTARKEDNKFRIWRTQ